MYSDRPAWARHAEMFASCSRIAPLIDGVEYFRAVREALLGAERQVLVLGWDLHSEIDLLRGEEADDAQRQDGYSVRLANLLEHLVEEREQLHVALLIWEGASLFAFERQHLPRMKRPWAAHERLRLVWDRQTPLMGSHHQKIVVVDDRVAFVGGIDLTQSRWDDHDHACDDRRRRRPGLIPSYTNPRHEAGIVLGGDGARALGAFCRERWHRAGGTALEEPRVASAGGDPWPSSVEPVFRDHPVAIALTQPALDGQPEKRQVERTYLDQIRSAQRLVYIENQYFTSGKMCDALCERLRDSRGPEVVLILPYGCPGAIQSMALDPHRDGLLDRLRDADPGGRLGIYWPTLRGGQADDVHQYAVYIHAKTMVVDDLLVRIGSANLANRSMGVDTECDAFLRVDPEDGEATAAIASYRRRSLGYLLGAEPESIERAERDTGSVVAAIESLATGERMLHAFDHRADANQRIVIPIELADPDRPLSVADAQRAAEAIAAELGIAAKIGARRDAAIGWLRRNKRAIVTWTVLALVAALWWWSPLRQAVDEERVRQTIERIQEARFASAGVVAAFWLAATAGVPVTLLIATVGVVFHAPIALAISLLGVAGSAAAGFAIGRRLPAPFRRRRLGTRLERVTQRIADRGVLGMALLRNLPLMPYAVMNVVCGATPIRWGAYLAGTLLGMIPGIVLLSVFGQELRDWISDPSPAVALRLALVVALLAGIATGADWLARSRRARKQGEVACERG